MRGSQSKQRWLLRRSSLGDPKQVELCLVYTITLVSVSISICLQRGAFNHCRYVPVESSKIPAAHRSIEMKHKKTTKDQKNRT